MATQIEVMTYQESSVADLLQSHVQSKKDSIDTLQKKAQYNFTAINILAAVMAGFSIDNAGTILHPTISGIPAVLVVLMSVLYAVVGFLSISALRVKKRRSIPMTPDEETVDDWMRCTVEHHKKLLRDSYLLVYKDTDNLEQGIAKKVEWGQRLIMAGTVLFMLQALISLPPVVDVVNGLVEMNT